MARFILPSLVLSVTALACGSVASSGSPDSGSSGHASSSGPASASSSGFSSRPGSSSSAASGASGSNGSSAASMATGSTTLAPPVTETKVDLLFDIDNSASMGDKQVYLATAIPELVARLVTPRCIAAGTGTPTGTNADPSTGACPAGSSPEFAPVKDMHIGVITSSLGPRLGVATGGSGGGATSYICDPSETVTSQSGTTVSAFNDDQAHLINRTAPFGSGPVVANAVLPEGGGFLYWFPTGTPTAPPVAYTNSGLQGTPGSGTLVGDFTELVGGAGESGCGIESQLESWYRFLVQPDPYASLVLQGANATWSGVDTTLLQQRHDFLRPDSVVAVVVLTDENDSEIDVRSYQGSGYQFLSNTYSPPRATSACLADPTSASCASCAGCPGAGGANCNDPSCQLNGGEYTQTNDGNDWGYNLNLRHVHMAQKYALDPQYPLTRYANGLTSSTVPNRVGEYPNPGSSYAGNNDCTNPLFAASLPTAADVPDATATTPAEVMTTLCNLPQGHTRTAGDAFFLHIGGVPHQLLQSTPGDGTCPSSTAAADCPQKPVLASSDWVKILGKGAASYTAAGGAPSYDYTGIDPHMIESMIPRNNLGGPSLCTGTVCPGASEPAPASDPSVTTLMGPALVTTATDPVRPDPVNGREWTDYTGTHSLPVDRQFACIFQLPPGSQRDCAALSEDSIQGNSCECPPGGNWVSGMPGATGNTSDEISPLCSMTSTDGTITSAVADYTVQTYAKAYPTIRELTLTSMLGSQGVASSLCPIHTVDNASGNDPVFGYRPAVDALVDRMKGALTPSNP